MMAMLPSRFRWPFGFITLLVFAVPAFSGWGLDYVPGHIVPGISWGWVAYLWVIHGLVFLLLERRWYANILTISAMVTLPVVFVGALITRLGFLVGIVRTGTDAAGVHYAVLCITMLTVVPLALALVAMIPFQRLEQRLLYRPEGVTLRQKKVLMVLRVFNHTAFFVIPSLLEVLREERAMTFQQINGNEPFSLGRRSLHRIRRLLQIITYLAVQSICAAIQFIPLWAYEIGSLPEPDETPGRVEQAS